MTLWKSYDDPKDKLDEVMFLRQKSEWKKHTIEIATWSGEKQEWTKTNTSEQLKDEDVFV